eukprot:jgi/Psemu1/309232/fgenesh1_kg.490_\
MDAGGLVSIMLENHNKILSLFLVRGIDDQEEIPKQALPAIQLYFAQLNLTPCIQSRALYLYLYLCFFPRNITASLLQYIMG